ncbi:MAG TPA: hypothetical protein VNW04_14695 [Puia sp.]|nr:hypothetical protein [Puia sp.]
MSTIQTSCLQFLLCLCLAIPTLAQSPPADSTQSISAARATIYYQAYIGQDAALYNGVAYQQNYRGVEGDPYFETANLKTGTVIYEDITYSHIPLLYDLVHDQVAIADKTGQLLIPAPGKLRRFSFDNHSFLYLAVNNTSGFYELLSPGYATLLARHTKTITEKIEGGDLRRIITTQHHYFLFKQDRYYPVESGKHLLTLLTDKKKELQQFQHSHHLRFRKDPEKAMEAIIEYYNQLSH